MTTQFYGCAGFGVGRICYASCELGIMTEITATTIVITAKANPTGTTTAPTAPIECIFEQMPVGALAVMVQGCRQLARAGRA